LATRSVVAGIDSSFIVRNILSTQVVALQAVARAPGSRPFFGF